MQLKLKTGTNAEGFSCVGFEYDGSFVTNPYESECSRFASPHVYYGCPDDLAFAMTVVNRYLRDATYLGKELQALGLALIGTGGGCTAWHLQNTSHFIWLTDSMGTGTDVNREELLLLGYYSTFQADTEALECAEGKWDEIKPLVEAFIAGQWKPKED